MQVTDFLAYREFLQVRIKSAPKGEVGRVAAFLKIQSSMISQILKGKREISLEHACKLCEYWKFSDEETQYFVLLVQHEKAGTEKLREVFKNQLHDLRNRAALSRQGKIKLYEVNERDRTEFYSAWYYSAVRLASSISKYRDISSIAERLGLSEELVRNILKFLIEAGLCVRDGDVIKMGPSRTHLESDFPSRLRHHTNWRVKALDRLPHHAPPELYLAFPMSVSKTDQRKIRDKLLKFMEEINGVVRDSPPETLSCLNIDWFEF